MWLNRFLSSLSVQRLRNTRKSLKRNVHKVFATAKSVLSISIIHWHLSYKTFSTWRVSIKYKRFCRSSLLMYSLSSILSIAYLWLRVAYDVLIQIQRVARSDGAYSDKSRQHGTLVTAIRPHTRVKHRGRTRMRSAAGGKRKSSWTSISMLRMGGYLVLTCSPFSRLPLLLSLLWIVYGGVSRPIWCGDVLNKYFVLRDTPQTNFNGIWIKIFVVSFRRVYSIHIMYA